MSKVIQHNDNGGVDRLERFQSLQAGQYWRARLPVQHEGIDVGVVLLIESIKWVDNAPHTIILRAHPEKIGKSIKMPYLMDNGSTQYKHFSYATHHFLVTDFLAGFEYEPDYLRIRQEELMRVQNKISSLQQELVATQSNKDLLGVIVKEGLDKLHSESTTSSSFSIIPAHQAPISLGAGAVETAVAGGITEASIDVLKKMANQEHQIATIKLQWIQGKTTEIATAIKAMTPFYEEQAAAAMAQTEDVRTHIAKLMDGIGSLDLYVGKNVTVETIVTGSSASFNEPLTIMQKKLMMDEELAVWADIDETFDFAQEDVFIKALQEHKSLIKQIFSTPRCIVVMAVTRSFIDYGDTWINDARNAENKKVFLLARDGENIYRIYSPVESHLGSSKLFPSKDDQDRLFRGIDGEQVSFEDIAYTKKLENHEKHALHYKRFLLLIAGLDHRLQLFGAFYEAPASFVSMAFQSAHMRFIHDDDGAGLLPAEDRLSVKAWITEKNSYLRSGSRVLCKWDSLLTDDNAPSAFRPDAGGREYYQAYYPGHTMGVAIAYRSQESLCVDVELSGKTISWVDRTFHGKVFISSASSAAVNVKSTRKWALRSTETPLEIGSLCLDAVSVNELHWYIHNRGDRRNHVEYIRFFKLALKFVENELVIERDTRDKMRQALNDGRIVDTQDKAAADALIQKAVIAWRAENRGRPLPVSGEADYQQSWRSLLDLMFLLVNTDEKKIAAVESLLRDQCCQPLRLTVSGKAELVVYVAPKQDERDDRLQAHSWVHKITLKVGKNGLQEKSRNWAFLPAQSASETTIHEWPEACDWIGLESIFPSFQSKQRILAVPQDFNESLSPFIAPMTSEVFAKISEDWLDRHEELLDKSKFVKFPSLNVPFAVVYYPKAKWLCYLCVSSDIPHAMIYRHAPDEHSREIIKSAFLSCWVDKKTGLSVFERDLANVHSFVLTEVPISLTRTNYSCFSKEDRVLVRPKISTDCSLDRGFLNRRLAAVDNKFVIWTSNTVLDDKGDSCLDKLTRMPIDQVSEQVCVVELSSVVDHRSHRWIDIYSSDNQLITENLESVAKCELRFMAKSIDCAREYIQSKGVSSFNAYTRVETNSNEVLPDGCLERWVVTSK